MCFDSIKIFIYIDEVILIIIMVDEKLVPKLRFWKEYKLKDLLTVKSSSISINQLEDNTGKYQLYGLVDF